MYNFYTFWSMWPSTWRALSALNRLFLVILAVVAVYSVISATIALKTIRALRSIREEDAGERKLAALSRRCANLRQILGATFFLFGFLFFLGLPNATVTIGDGPGFPAFEILSNFVFSFVYATNVFLIFLVLHVIQWVTSNRVQACARRLQVLPQG